MSDIEDFTTDQLRAEIRRREEANRASRCWYCGQNIAAHTCKYAKPSPCPGWDVEPARFVRTDDCMANEVEYWETDARNPVTGRTIVGTGATADEATAKCVGRVMDVSGIGPAVA